MTLLGADPREVDGEAEPEGELSMSAAVLRAGLAMGELDMQQLWVGYVALGGSMTQPELDEVLRGARDVSGHEHDLLTQALNDDFTSRGQDHPVPYSEDVESVPDQPRHGTRHR